MEFSKLLLIIGSQIEEVGHTKARKYEIGQIGTFNGGTRGRAGVKLLGISYVVPQYRVLSITPKK